MKKGNIPTVEEVEAARIIIKNAAANKGKKSNTKPKYTNHRGIDYDELFQQIVEADTKAKTYKFITSILKACTQPNSIIKLVKMLQEEYSSIAEGRYDELPITTENISSYIDELFTNQIDNKDNTDLYNIEFALSLTKAVKDNSVNDPAFGSNLYRTVVAEKLRYEFSLVLLEGKEEELGKYIVTKDGQLFTDYKDSDFTKYINTGEGTYKIDEARYYNRVHRQKPVLIKKVQ
jgi:hypothetical protein